MSLYTIRGIDHLGVEHDRRTAVLNVPVFVQHCYALGWTVLHLDCGHTRVGEIGSDDDGRRWWCTYNHRSENGAHQITIGEVMDIGRH